MHGRVKVRTSEEERAKKEMEKAEKLKIFQQAMQIIQNKRAIGELDSELLELTGKVLSSTPDINTLWNIRREILTIYRSNQESEEEVSKLNDAEIKLTEYCLKINPKSYCAWHHRKWVLTTRPDPDWNKEMALCDTYLKLDERNFHTWDYRRFVVDQCKPPLEGEFNYTTDKLYENFSNYSAWHYRSKMLVELYPDKEGGRPIDDHHHKCELTMVQSAAFTDPDDTSAWFYLRWLLGAVKTTINLVVCAVSELKTTVAFNEFVSREFVSSKTTLFINDSILNGEWYSSTGNDNDVLWILKHNAKITDDMDIKVEFETENGDKKVIPCVHKHSFIYVGKNEITFQKIFSEPVIEELNKQLESCRQLLALEPDNKWTLLTTTIFLHSIDGNLHHKEVIENLHALKVIDPKREGFYDHMMSKWNMEFYLQLNYGDTSLDWDVTIPERLTSLPYLQYYSFCENVNLSNQSLTSKILPFLVALQHCKILSLENNKLTTLKEFPDLELKELHLNGNEDLDENEVEQFKNKCNFNIFFKLIL